MIPFTNPDTEASYVNTNSADLGIRIPNVYKGRTSDIPPAVAEVLINQHYSWIQRKPGAEVSPELLTDVPGVGVCPP